MIIWLIFMFKNINKSWIREHVLYQVLFIGFITQLHETIG